MAKPQIFKNLEDIPKPLTPKQVVVYCYEEYELWNDRKNALDCYLSGMICSEGSERDRYTNLYSNIKTCKDCNLFYDDGRIEVLKISTQSSDHDIEPPKVPDSIEQLINEAMDYAVSKNAPKRDVVKNAQVADKVTSKDINKKK